MRYIRQTVSLVAVLLFAVLLVNNVSASFGSITNVKVNDVKYTGTSMAVFAGQSVPVTVAFTATGSASDVRIKVWLSGDSSYAAYSDRFEVVSGGEYVQTVFIPMPANIDTTEPLQLKISVESQDDSIPTYTVNLAAQRESYTIEFLDVQYNTKVSAGDTFALDVILKNRGFRLAEDTFVRAKIPALGIESRAYFGDMSAIDQADPDKEDAAERKVYLTIPQNAPSGIYEIQIEAYNADSSAILSRKVLVASGSASSSVVSSVTSKSFATGETGTYTLTLVNTGSQLKVYQLTADAPSDLNVDVTESVIAVPAGSSHDVKINVESNKAGNYNFAVNAYSNGELVTKQNFAANVKGNAFAGNTTVLLTVILAIIFVVLLVVLIVLLTRKPSRTEEFGESYY